MRNEIEYHIILPIFYKLVQNLTDINFSREELKVVELDFQYIFVKKGHKLITDRIIDTDNVFRQLDLKIQNTDI